MQQQIPQQEQYGNHQQISQPMMICPIQYVYETPMLMPQPQEEQVQQNQILLNVQNPPPWIQNRPQNQVIYVQQVPNNYQTYIHPHMIQNPIYHPQINYQIQQPILTQDNRQYVQIPNIAHYNTVQSQPAQTLPQQVNNEEAEKMPLLTQMLNQKSSINNVRTPNATNVRPATPTASNTNINMPRPVTQNQQVQTNISANNKGRPRNAQPQIITINPMQQRQYVNVNQKPDVVINITRPGTPYIRTDVPQHIRSKIPSSISVKTVARPMQLRPIIRPFDVMPGPQNFIYNPNFVTPPNPPTRNMMTNTETSYLKQNNNYQGDRSKPSDTNVPVTAKMPIAKEQNDAATQKQQIDANAIAKSKSNLVKITNNNAEQPQTGSNNVGNIENQTQTEEKLIRNTVYVQARGRVLTEKEIPQNRSPKRTSEEETTANNPNSQEDLQRSNKYIRIEVTDSTSQTSNFTAKAPARFDSQQTRTNNLPANSDNTSTNLNLGIPDERTNATVLNSQKAETSNPTKEDKTDLEQRNTLYDKMASEREERVEDKKEHEIPGPVNESPVFREDTNLRDLRQKYDDKGGKIEVLTHVLDGYIIQESNVAFPIYKPIVEKETRQEKEQAESNPAKTDDALREETEANTAKPHVQWKNLNTSTETKKVEPVAINKDDPFANIQKSTVESWTTEELAAHLEKYDWRETAAKLQDEEIDGQSILLVNRDQLVTIGVCESHAEAIAAFSAS